MNPPSQLELLAPAGSLESLRAALANGADAVYLGLDRFSARRRAENFSLETLPDALELTRRCGAKLYVAMNTLLRDGEVDHAATYLQQLCELGIDALIVQDPALAALAAEACPSLALHASTQLTLAEPLAITAAAERWGLKRVILPRETSLEDLATIRRDTSVELEMFVHGAMCISYSGQCQASRHLGHRSGNRGECAQPCRLDWEMQSDGKAVSTPGHHLLSPRDLCLANRLGDLATAGATSFKIEGRLKSPEYVAAVVGVYRSLLDDVLEGTPRTMTQSESDRLTLAFSRGFSEGYVDGNVHNKLVDTTVAGNVGLAVGVVTRVFGGETLFVRMREEAGELEAGDGLAFGAFDEDDRRPGGILFNTRRAASGQFEIIVGRSNGLDNVQPGDELYLTSAPSLQREIRQSFTRVEPHRRVPLCIEVEASVDTPLRLRAGEITVESETPLEASERKPLTLEFLQTQLAKLSNTPFSLESVTLTGPDGPADELGVFVPASLVNQLRRELTEALVASAHPAKPFDTGAMSRLRESLESLPAAPEIEKTILVRHRDQVLPAAKTLSKRSGLGRLWLELPRQQIPDAIEQCLDLGIAAGVVSPRVMGPDQRAYLDDLLSISGITGMLARNITALQATRAAHPEWLIVADWSLNAINPLAAAELLALGADRVAPGLDANDVARKTMTLALDPARIEALRGYHAALFYTQYCPISHHLAAGADYPHCGQPCKDHHVTLIHDEAHTLEVRRDGVGRIEILDDELTFPSKPRGDSTTRIEFLTETAEEIEVLLGSALLRGEAPAPLAPEPAASKPVKPAKPAKPAAQDDTYIPPAPREIPRSR